MAWSFILFIVFAVMELGLQAQDENVVAMARANSWEVFDKTSNDFRSGYMQHSEELFAILKDSKSSNLNRCAAAYYLGEMHVPNASGTLANSIILQFDKSQLPLVKHLETIEIPEHQAMEALIKIGNPSIPAVIRNLAETDDTKVRDLSLQVLYRIDGDKDIVQLRLQKALKAEKDSQKQARLQSALKALAETSFAN